MFNIANTFESLGMASLHWFWSPVIIWTGVACLATVLFRIFPKIPTSYHYHGRVALLWSLPAGILASAALKTYAIIAARYAGSASTTFIVIHSPLTVPTTSPAVPVYWSNPGFLLGAFTAIILLTAIAGLTKFAADYLTLKTFIQHTEKEQSSGIALSGELQHYEKELSDKNISLIFSENIDIPCTFGRQNKRILLPKNMHGQPQKIRLALRHELMHIRHHDYLINSCLKIIKALFLFHPLVLLLERKAVEYRELYCDQNVLTDSSISQKSYASLLFELAPKQVFRTSATVNMSVSPSTLKKRIETMKTSSRHIVSPKRSVSLLLLSAIIIIGFMACSDVEDSGITKSDVQKTQAQISINAPTDNEPLYVVNSEVMKSRDILSRIKPEYIKSVNVLKGDKASKKYGQQGKNGVIEITLLNKEKALSDLLDKAPSIPAQPHKPKGDYFIAVEEQPNLVGGITALQKKVNYPESCQQANVQGQVTVQFIVNKEGNVEDSHIIRGIGSGCDKEALRVVKQAKFTPGRQRGQKVRVQMSLPIMFKLTP